MLTINERRRPCYCQLTAVRKGYPLTSITRPYRVLRFQLIKGLNPGNVFFLGHFSLTSYNLLVNLRLKFNFFFPAAIISCLLRASLKRHMVQF